MVYVNSKKEGTVNGLVLWHVSGTGSVINKLQDMYLVTLRVCMFSGTEAEAR